MTAKHTFEIFVPAENDQFFKSNQEWAEAIEPYEELGGLCLSEESAKREGSSRKLKVTIIVEDS